MMLTFQATATFAQKQELQASAATSRNDIELRKTLDRALDKVLVQDQVIKAKDEVIAAQDKAIAECTSAKDGFKRALESTEGAFQTEKKAKETADAGWKDSEKRAAQLEKQLRKSDNKVKWMAVGAVAAIVTTFFLSRSQ